MDASDMFGCRQRGTREKFFILTSNVTPQLWSSCLQRGKTTWLKSKTNAPGLKYHQDWLRTSRIQWCCRRRAVCVPLRYWMWPLRCWKAASLRHWAPAADIAPAPDPHHQQTDPTDCWRTAALLRSPPDKTPQDHWEHQFNSLRWPQSQRWPTRREAHTHTCRTLSYNVLLFRSQITAPCKDKMFSCFHIVLFVLASE